MNHKQYLYCVKLVRQAYKSKAKTGIPAIPVAAQGLLEGGHEGKGELYDYKTGKRSYNIFGIKAYPEKGLIGNNGWVQSWTHEQIGKKKELRLCYFRAYKSFADCFSDHAEVLKLPRYKKAFDYLDDPEKFIEEVWKGGYASDSRYLTKIIPIIRQLNKIPVWMLRL